MNQECWTEAKKSEAWESTSEACNKIDSTQSTLFTKFRKMLYMYDPRQLSPYGPTRRRTSVPGFNIMAISVEAVHASLASQTVRTRISTDGAEWTIQKQARLLQSYLDNLNKTLKVSRYCKRSVWTASLKGLGATKVVADRFGKIRLSSVQPDDIYVNDEETDNCENSKLHHRYRVDVRDLISQYPKKKKYIEEAAGQNFGPSRKWDKRKISSHQVVVIESWCLAVGEKTKEKTSYSPGRHTICINGADLLDEEFNKKHFPFAFFRWAEGDGSSFYGVSGAERIALHQIKLGKLDQCTDRQIELNGRPVTYTTMANIALIGQRTINATGQYVPTADGSTPKTVTPPSVSNEQLSYRERTKREGFEAFGTSRQLIDGSVPAGIESGVGVREASAVATGRWALQEQDFEQLNLDVMWLILDVCKDLGKDAPKVTHSMLKGKKKLLNWADVDIELVRSQMEPASSIARDFAGRASLANELAQAGLISQEEGRKLMDNPDIRKSMSIYTAKIDKLDRIIEAMLYEDEIIMPTPHDPHAMGVWRFTQAILVAENDGAPEEAIERLRNWRNNAADMLDDMAKKQAAAAAPPPPMPGAPAPEGLDPAAMPVEQMVGAV